MEVLIINIKILVAAHKAFPMPTDERVYMPVLVGATNNYSEGMTYQRDDLGMNISLKNSNYSELTAIYWAWKNLRNTDAVGLVHYRRFFYVKGKHTLNNVASEDEIAKILQKCDVIVPRKRCYYIETNYSHYIHAHHAEPLVKTREIIKFNFPDYLSSFDIVMKKRSAHMFNMFIMKNEQFNQYCEFIFGVLMKLESQIDIEDYSIQEARVFGYVSELLMDVWLYATNTKYLELPWGQIGSKHTIQKIFHLIQRKIGIGSKQTHF